MHIVLRLAIFFIFVFSGYILGIKYNYGTYGVLLGGLLGLFAIATEYLFKNIRIGTIMGGILGLSFGLLFAHLLILPLKQILGEDMRTISFGLMAVLQMYVNQDSLKAFSFSPSLFFRNSSM